MAYKNIDQFIAILEENNELIRVKEFVSINQEITEIVDRFSKLHDGGKAILFENNETDFPVLMNMMGSEKRMALALGKDSIDEIGEDIDRVFKQLTSPKESVWDKLKMLPFLKEMSDWMPNKQKGKGDCQEVVMKDPDITKLPVLHCWPEDGGRFVTFPMVNTIDPVTGIRNMGMYRLQIFDKDLTGMHWHLHKTGARHFNEYKEKCERMPVTVTLGGDPAYTYSATAPLPDNIDEYMLAGFIRKKKVDLVKCLTNDIYVPSDVDFVIEGYVDPEEELIWEGPFGDHTGFYSLPDWYPKFHITCITHRKKAVYPATIVGIPPMEDAYIGKATERIFLRPIQIAMLPEVKDMNLPFAGVAHNLTIISIEKSFAGHAQKVINALWGVGQMMFNKFLIIVDDTVNVHDYTEVVKAIAENVDWTRDCIQMGGPMDVLDHAAPVKAYGSKFGIDATVKYKEETGASSKEKNEPLDENKLSELKSKFNLQEIIIGDKLALIFRGNKEQDEDLIQELKEIEQSFFVLAVDSEVPLDFQDIVWVAGNNIDPRRDTQIIRGKSDSFVFMNARTKYESESDRVRQWPNTIVSTKEIIKRVDERWESLRLGGYISSPSLKYYPLMKGSKAFISDKNNKE